MNTTVLRVEVASIVPDIPSAPGRRMMLADFDVLTRAVVTRGDLVTLGNAYWVGDVQREDGVAGLGLGEVVSRASLHEQLSRGPLRIGLPAALIMLIPATLLLAIGGLVMHVVSDLRVRSLEVARLRAIGMSRRSVVGLLLAQHGGLLALLLACGAVVGALAAAFVGPLLIRSDLGAEPAPPALPIWPWADLSVLIAGLLVAGLIVIRTVSSIQTRRAER